MGKVAGKIFWIVLLILGSRVTVFSADDMSGSAASLKNFALPEYSRENGRLQFILYGESARNLGARVFLTNPKIDIVKNDIIDIHSIISLATVQPYPLAWTASQVADFWKNVHHSQALIFSDDAEYDKNLKMLRGDSPVHFRSREMSVDGVGFDADQERRFIHVRSKVKVVIYQEARKKSGIRSNSTDHGKEEKK